MSASRHLRHLAVGNAWGIGSLCPLAATHFGLCPSSEDLDPHPRTDAPPTPIRLTNQELHRRLRRAGYVSSTGAPEHHRAGRCRGYLLRRGLRTGRRDHRPHQGHQRPRQGRRRGIADRVTFYASLREMQYRPLPVVLASWRAWSADWSVCSGFSVRL
jgi:hypothetical protein